MGKSPQITDSWLCYCWLNHDLFVSEILTMEIHDDTSWMLLKKKNTFLGSFDLTMILVKVSIKHSMEITPCGNLESPGERRSGGKIHGFYQENGGLPSGNLTD